MKVDVLLGLQWGDEGKGKIVDVLAPQYDIVARFQGGPNAGHTIIFDSRKFVLHTIPSGIFYSHIMNVIGNGVILDPYSFIREIDNLVSHGFDVKQNLFISRRAHLILPTHRLLDTFYEEQKGKNKIGSTLKGIGPTYTDKISRNGVRVGDLDLADFEKIYNELSQKHIRIFEKYNFDYKNTKIEGISFVEYEKRWFKAIELLKDFNFINSEYFLNSALSAGKTILAEGAQGSMLDIEFGTYPYVTSSNTTVGGVCTGLGIPPHKIGKIFGIFKAYTTRVGNGPFPTELFDQIGKKMGEVGKEFGATTGRSRRCGWLDLVSLKYAIMISGVTDLFMMKTDVLSDFEELSIAKKYEVNGVNTEEYPLDSQAVKPIYNKIDAWTLKGDNKDATIPQKLNNYIKEIEDFVQVPIKAISIGPEREKIIYLY